MYLNQHSWLHLNTLYQDQQEQYLRYKAQITTENSMSKTPTLPANPHKTRREETPGKKK